MAGLIRVVAVRQARRLAGRVGRAITAPTPAVLLAAVLLAGCGLTSPRPEPGPRPAGPTVEVLRGDSIYTIADRHGVPLRDLIEINNLRPPYSVSPGGVLVLPPTREYVVQPDDSLSQVASRFGVPTEQLARLNGLEPPYTIYAGQGLRLPASAMPPVAAADPTRPATAAPVPGTPATGTPATGAPRPGTRPVPAEPTGPLGPPTRLTPTDRTVEVELLPPLERPGDGAAGALPAAGAPGRSEGEVAVAPPPDALADDVTVTPPAEPEADPATAEPSPRAGFRWPLQGPMLAGYGPAGDGGHNDGINIGAPQGTPIVAADNGIVAYAGNELRGYGNLLLIRHADGWVTAYAHTDRILVAQGDRVQAGQTVATVGSSGAVSDPQLHFEIRRGSDSVDPLDHLP